MPSIKVRDPFQRLAMRGAIFITEVGSLLAALLALSTVNPAYARSNASAWAENSTRAQDVSLSAQTEDLLRAIDNGGLDWSTSGLWMSADVNERLQRLWTSVPESARTKWSAKIKKALAAKIQKQLGARQGAAWAAWSALANW